MPDLHDLDHFDEGLPALDLLPAAEIRKRGDRMRRRRTALVAAGGVLAVGVAIGTPVIALSGTDGRASQNPTVTQPSDTAKPAEWLQEIPRSIDIGLLPDDATFSFQNWGSAGVDDFSMCGASVFSTTDRDAVGPPVDTDGATTGLPENEFIAGRTLALYRNDAEAHAALQTLRDGVEHCPSDPNGRGATLVRRIEDASLPADESFVYSQRSQMDADLLADLQVFQVARFGNALYLAVEGGGPGDEQSVAIEVERLAAFSGPVIADLDATFSAPSS